MSAGWTQGGNHPIRSASLPDRLLTVTEAATWAKVSNRTMTHWVKSGLLPTVRDGRYKLVRLKVLQQLMRDRYTSPGRKLPANTVIKKLPKFISGS